MILALAIIGIALMCIGIACVYEKKDAIEVAIVGLTYFFFSYIVASGVLFWIDKFSVYKVLVLVVVVGVVLDLYLMLVMKKRPSLSYDYRKSIIPLIIFIIVLPVTFSKFGYFGMGQDQGVYQTKALELIYGNNSNVVDFEEYDDLTEEMDQTTFEREVDENLLGYYLYDKDVPSLNKADYSGKMSGVLHGVPTFSAMLALYGKIFGYANMTGIQTLVLLCAIFLMYYVLRNLKVRKVLSTVAVLMFAISPIVLWSSKSSLTEMFISVIILMYLYMLTDEEHKRFAWLSFLSIAVFSFYHITIYTVMPMFVLVYLALYFTTKEKQYLWANMWAVITYLLGFFMMVRTSGVYTCGNYNKIFRLGINESNYQIVVTVTVLITLALSMVLIFISEKYPEAFRIKAVRFIRRHMRWIVRMVIAISIVVLILAYRMSGTVYSYTTIYAYIVSSGFIVVPFLFAVLLCKPQFITANKNHLLLTIMFFYTVVMYSCVLKPYIGYYYYYGRYIVPYLPIILILAALRLDNMQVSEKVKRRVPCAVAVVMFIVMLPYNWTLVIQRDDTWMSWEIIEDMSQKIQGNDAVIIESELSSTLKFPIKIMTGADTYPRTDNMVGQVDRLQKTNDNVYYIGTELWIMSMQCSLENVYSNTNLIQEDLSNTDEVKESKKIIPFSLEFSRTRQNIIMFRCTYEE